ncbi:hypothetical protein PoMZ_03456 [Pyricularia oryzae]|uniref:Uncharacterized protein n=1 Tax=Pyricularia oryzae TaxID=318829 RepID=A0A4P7N7R2_PYROR|nr:hypothetical protein PoMZ_03456 [Pyricularia oryzae]
MFLAPTRDATVLLLSMPVLADHSVALVRGGCVSRSTCAPRILNAPIHGFAFAVTGSEY